MKKIVIIGSSAVAVGVIRKLVKFNLVTEASAQAKKFDITCISKEPFYNKCFLVDYISKEKKEAELFTLSNNFLEKQNIKFIQGTVRAIDREVKSVKLTNGETVKFDKLILGMGSSAINLNIPSLPKNGIFNFHTLRDALNLFEFVDKNKSKRAVIVGAGITGLECADALWRLGLEVCVVDRASQLMPRFLDQDGSKFLTRLMNRQGIQILLGEEIQSVYGNSKVETVCLKSNKKIKTDLVIFSIGVKPNSELAEDAGLKLDGRHVMVNEFLQTSDTNIYAAGDLIRIKNVLTSENLPSCLWADAMLQGAFIASNLAGETKAYPGSLMITQTHIFGCELAKCGIVEKGEIQQSKYFYEKNLTDGQFIHIGNIERISELKRKILSQIVF